MRSRYVSLSLALTLPACSLLTPLDGLSSGGASASPHQLDEAKVETATPLAIVRDAGAAAPAPADAAASTTGPPFSDDFTFAQLAAGWTFTDPLGDSSYSLMLTPGRLYIQTPGGTPHDCFLTADCPRIMRTIDNALKRTFVVDVSSLPSSYVEGFGLLLWQDAAHYLRVEIDWGTQGEGTSVDTYTFLNGVFAAGPTSGLVKLTNQTKLRVVRDDAIFAMSYSSDGGATWNSLQSPLEVPIALAAAGVHVVNARGSLPTTIAVFDAFAME
jgi:hypothetical protein